MNSEFGISLTIREKDERIAKLTRAVELLQYEKLKCAFVRGFMTFLARNLTFDELIHETVLFLRQEFKATYAAVFLYHPDEYNFTYLYGSGYKPSLLPEPIDESGSILGETIHTNDTVVVTDMKERYFHIPLNQTPPEYNVVCMPVFTKKKTLVFRIANTPDSALMSELASTLPDISGVLGKTLDTIYQNSINQQTLRGVQFSLSISRLLEKSLDRREILHRAFERIAALNSSTIQIIVSRETDTPVVFEKSHPDFFLGGSSTTQQIYLKNLFETYPDGNGFIENIHKIPRWSWPNMNVCSLNLAPITLDGQLVGTMISISRDEPFTESARSLMSLTASQLSITLERAFYFRQQEEFASKDGLTGLLNRRMFDTLLASETAVASRYKRPLSLVILDIDFFKKFNDTYGHKTGDEVLQLVSRTISATIRTSDRAFRYGGEEFVILCPETNSQNTALLANRLRQRVEATRTAEGLTVTISLGVTEYITAEQAEQFVRRADSLLYQSKEAGRNRVTRG